MRHRNHDTYNVAPRLYDIDRLVLFDHFKLEEDTVLPQLGQATEDVPTDRFFMDDSLSRFEHPEMDVPSLDRTFSGSNTEDVEILLCHICGGNLTYCTCSLSPSNIESRRTSEQTSPATTGVELLSLVQGPSVSEDRKQVCPFLCCQLHCH